MGSTIVEIVRATEDVELTTALDVEGEISPESLNATEVVANLSILNVAESNVHALLDAGIDVAVGTTDWIEESCERVRVYAEELNRAVLIAPNFAVGAVLAMRFAAPITPYFKSAEAIEMYHPNEVDAPSGTAITAVRGTGAAHKGTGLDSMPDATQSDPEGTHGGLIDGVPIHAVRSRGLTTSEEILLDNPDEQLVIRADSFDWVSLMPGVILTIRSIQGRVGLTVGLDKILGI